MMAGTPSKPAIAKPAMVRSVIRSLIPVRDLLLPYDSLPISVGGSYWDL
jgi:hypothetical protein